MSRNTTNQDESSDPDNTTAVVPQTTATQPSHVSPQQVNDHNCTEFNPLDAIHPSLRVNASSNDTAAPARSRTQPEVNTQIIVETDLSNAMWPYLHLEQESNKEQYADKIVMEFNSQATAQYCYLTGENFLMPIPLAFFYEGDRTKPVCPSEAHRRSFTIGLVDLYAVNRALGNPSVVGELVQCLHDSADNVRDYDDKMQGGQAESTEWVDDYFDLKYNYDPVLARFTQRTIQWSYPEENCHAQQLKQMAVSGVIVASKENSCNYKYPQYRKEDN